MNAPGASLADDGRGSFIITLEELRNATSDDAPRVEAAKLFAEGRQLLEQRTSESRKKAIDIFQRALPLARDAHDKDSESGVLYDGRRRRVLGC